MAHVTPAAQKEYKLYLNRPCSWWKNNVSNAASLQPVLSDSITVHVYLDSVAQINAVVYLYYRINGKLIGRQLTDKNGQVIFTGLNSADASAYFAVANISGSLNALILDKL